MNLGLKPSRFVFKFPGSLFTFFFIAGFGPSVAGLGAKPTAPSLAVEGKPCTKQHQINSAAVDFAQLGRYQGADVALHVTSKEPVRVVFLGDSILDYWGRNEGVWFKQSGWINRGIGGQTTSQMLLRERNDVLKLHPQAVVLEGGSNDMRLGFIPQQIRDNIATMGELAQEHHIRVFVTTMTPVCDCVRKLTGLRRVPRISRLNELLKDLCAHRHWTLIDLNPVLADNHGLMRAEYTVDGVHPNSAGYALSAPVLVDALSAYQ